MSATQGTYAPLYVYITTGMQAIFATRGMWSNGKPQGLLSGMLGPQIPLLSNDMRQAFYVTPEQLAALWRDILTVCPGAMGVHQRAQYLRRLREAAQRAELNIADILAATRGAYTPDACVPSASPKSAAPVPFRPLQRPAQGKAAVLFQDHVWRTVRDFVDYTQSSEYLGGEEQLEGHKA